MHSIRKTGATHCSKNNVPTCNTERRGRWKSLLNKMVRIYIDNNLPYPDASVAHVLNGSEGSCIYKLKDDFAHSIIDQVIPSLKYIFDNETVKVFLESNQIKTIMRLML